MVNTTILQDKIKNSGLVDSSPACVDFFSFCLHAFSSTRKEVHCFPSISTELRNQECQHHVNDAYLTIGEAGDRASHLANYEPLAEHLLPQRQPSPPQKPARSSSELLGTCRNSSLHKRYLLALRGRKEITVNTDH